MALAYFRVLIRELFNKDPDIFPEEAPLIILNIHSDFCMANIGKDTKYTSHIARRVNFVRNGENCKMHNICWCEVGLQLAYIVTNNVGNNGLNPRMK